MSLSNFSNVWDNSPYKGTDLLVHLAIADSIGATMCGEIHYIYLSRRARCSLQEAAFSAYQLQGSGHISAYSGLTDSPSVQDSFLCRLILCKPDNSKHLIEQKKETPRRMPPFDDAYLQKISGYVYLVQSGDYFKIGHTSNLSRRMIQFSLQLPHKPKLLHVIATDHHRYLEREIHENFSHVRMNGEWFRLTPDQLEEFRQYGCPKNGVIDERRRSHVVLDGEGFHVPHEFFPEEMMHI